jgi:hypothetical protein
MQYQKEQRTPLTNRDNGGKKLDGKAMERLLKRYQGIFKNNIHEFAERNKVNTSIVKNYAR